MITTIYTSWLNLGNNRRERFSCVHLFLIIENNTRKHFILLTWRHFSRRLNACFKRIKRYVTLLNSSLLLWSFFTSIWYNFSCSRKSSAKIFCFVLLLLFYLKKNNQSKSWLEQEYKWENKSLELLCKTF